MADTGERSEPKGFKINDRRRAFAEAPEPDAETQGKPSGEGPTPEGPGAARPAKERRTTDEALPKISFSTFVIGLSTQALVHLGEVLNPSTGKIEKDLPVAQQTIDIIGVLRDKTRGNLEREEERLMDDILFDLRMKYVKAVKEK